MFLEIALCIVIVYMLLFIISYFVSYKLRLPFNNFLEIINPLRTFYLVFRINTNKPMFVRYSQVRYFYVLGNKSYYGYGNNIIHSEHIVQSFCNLVNYQCPYYYEKDYQGFSRYLKKDIKKMVQYIIIRKDYPEFTTQELNNINNIKERMIVERSNSR